MRGDGFWLAKAHPRANARPPSFGRACSGTISQSNLEQEANTMTTQRAILAGGCFWGMQDLLRKQPGVASTRGGYSGGDVPNATYRNHGTHAESIEITFDPARISYRKLLEFFFQIHDPT